MEKETWRPVAGHEAAYEVSDLGRVRSLPRLVRYREIFRFIRGRILSPVMSGPVTQYAKVSIGGKTVSVHSLVMRAFVGPRPTGMVICHNDGNSRNNRLDNLRYDTQSSNLYESYRHGRSRERRPKVTPELAAWFRRSRLTLRELSRITGFHIVTISQHRNS